MKSYTGTTIVFKWNSLETDDSELYIRMWSFMNPVQRPDLMNCIWVTVIKFALKFTRTHSSQKIEQSETHETIGREPYLLVCGRAGPLIINTIEPYLHYGQKNFESVVALVEQPIMLRISKRLANSCVSVIARSALSRGQPMSALNGIIFSVRPSVLRSSLLLLYVYGLWVARTCAVNLAPNFMAYATV